MAKSRQAFSGELREIQGEVDSHVTTILDLARQNEKPPRVAVATPENPAEKLAIRPDVAVRESHKLAEGEPRRLLLNVTTRLTSDTNERLTEAALRQRLKKVTPATRQEIIEQAVQEWLTRHGYDDGQA